MVMDKELSVSMTCVVAYALWVVSFGLMVGSWFALDEQLGRASMWLCGAAVTATVRTYFIAMSRRVRAALIVAATEPKASKAVRPIR